MWTVLSVPLSLLRGLDSISFSILLYVTGKINSGQHFLTLVDSQFPLSPSPNS